MMRFLSCYFWSAFLLFSSMICLCGGCSLPGVSGGNDKAVHIGWVITADTGARAVDVYTLADSKVGVPAGWIVVDKIPNSVLKNVQSFGGIYLCVSNVKVPYRSPSPSSKFPPATVALTGYYVVSPYVYNLIKSDNELNAPLLTVPEPFPPLPVPLK